MSECRDICATGDALLQDNKVPSIPMYHFAWLKSLEDMHMQRFVILALACGPVKHAI